MESEVFRPTVYFSAKGPANTERALAIALEYARRQALDRIVVASSSGRTALRLAELAGPGMEIIAVTYGAGSRYREEVAAFDTNRSTLEARGVRIVRGLHALSGTERAFENRYQSGFIPLNVVADTLRMLSQGVKVCVEIAVMAAEAGCITPPAEVLCVAGSGEGADTVLVLRPAYAADLFATKVRTLLCLPA